MGFVGNALGSVSSGLVDPIANAMNKGPRAREAVSNAQLSTAYDESQQALQRQKAFIDALNAQNGVSNQSDVYNQLAGIASGQGPNPAQAMLANSTGANVANQAALMAGQRGAGSNVGLLARQAGMQGAATQQHAAGQAAALQAQQSLGAINQMGGIANQQVANQGNAIGGYNQYAQNEQNQLLQSVAAQNAANAGVNQQAMKGTQGLYGGVFNAAGSATGLAGGAGGASAPSMGNQAGGPDPSSVAMLAANGGEVPSSLSGPSSMAARFLSGHAMANGGQIKGEQYAAEGKVIPGKAKVKGDSLKNDTVKALLSPGEIIIPRSIAQHPDAPNKAAEFVAAVLAKSGKGLKGSKK